MRLFSTAAGVGLLLCCSAGVDAQGRKGRSAGWIGDYEVAKTQARKTGKPLMVVFRCEP